MKKSSVGLVIESLESVLAFVSTPSETEGEEPTNKGLRMTPAEILELGTVIEKLREPLEALARGENPFVKVEPETVPNSPAESDVG